MVEKVVFMEDADLAPPLVRRPVVTAIRGVSQRTQWAFFLIVLGVLRIFAARGLRIDSDEPQHLHLVWAWANGLIQYRDVFDNHSPLFQALCAPLFRLFPESAQIIIWMRLAMLPLFAFCLWSVYKLGTALFSRSVAGWTAIAAGFFPFFFFKSAEFRTDDLWAALWLWALVILLCGPIQRARSFFFGVVLGACFATSMKTVLLLGALAGAAMAVLGFAHVFGKKIDVRKLAQHIALALLGALLVPGAFLVFFAANHAVPALYYCVVQHNVLPHLKRWRHFDAHALWFPLSLPFLLVGTFFIFRFAKEKSVAARRALIFLATGFYVTALYSYWPDITGEDMIPLIPMAALVIVPAIFGLVKIAADRIMWLSQIQPALPALAVSAEIAFLCISRPPWHTYTQGDLAAIRDMLTLTRPGEYAMDAKAGAIYRPRPFYYVLETITRARIKAGLLLDDIPARLIATRTAVVRTNGFFPQDRQFVAQNYVVVAPEENLSVAGKILTPTNSAGEFAFDLVLPATYTVVNKSGQCVEGNMDGVPMTNGMFLAPGHHIFQSATNVGLLALVWSRAMEKGFRPVVP